jgi:enoyl-CoA hydratase/carnithine racemase
VEPYDTVKLTVNGPIATLTIDRPESANTLSRAVFRESVDAVDSIANDDEVRALVITGAGPRHFSGGVDLREFAGVVSGRDTQVNPPRLLFDVVEALPIPVIAALNGAAVGGGCELALACDIRVLSETAQIGLPEVLFGGLPGGGGTARLPRIIGQARAKEMILLGRIVDAATALRYGLVHEVVRHDEVLRRSYEIAGEIAALAPYVMRAAKFLLNEGPSLDHQAAVRLEATVMARMGTREERQAALSNAVVKSETYRRIFEHLRTSDQQSPKRLQL